MRPAVAVPDSGRRIWALVLLAAGLVVVLLRYWQEFPFDDGAFFMRYARNLAAGHGYVWNAGAKDAIGASAPFWPLLIAVPCVAGLDPHTGVLGVAVLLSFAAFFLILRVASAFWGPTALLPLTLTIASSGWMLACTMGGMETPLTVLLLVVAFHLVAMPVPRPTLTACWAALLAIHKIDLLPWSVGLLLAGGVWFPTARNLRAMAVALTIVGAYHAAMWLLTGHMFPVSFLCKLEQSSVGDSTLPWNWFLSSTLVQHGRWWLLLPAIPSLAFLLAKRSRMATFLGVGLAGQILAYTVLPPPNRSSGTPCRCSWRSTSWRVAPSPSPCSWRRDSGSPSLMSLPPP